MSKLQSVGSVAGKEVIYVDVDDEITAIIDKVQSAKGKVVALVLPKRATVLQSIVNMKLLKRTADTGKKNLVLVTSEAGLMPLAGAVGVHVASTPNSRPEIPPAPAGPVDEPELLDDPLDITDGNADEADDFDPGTARAKSVGELAAASAGKAAVDEQIDESIDMSDDAVDAADAGAGKAPKPKKNRKLAVPNFDSFRKKIALAVAAVIVLIVGLVFGLSVLPSAKVNIATDSSTIATNANLVLDTSAKALDITDNIVPASAQSQQKTDTQTVAATGQVNNGDKATGSVSMSAGTCTGEIPSDVPAGTSLSASGHTYILNGNVSFVPTASGKKCTFTSSSPAGVTALRGGADYNVSSATFTVTGRSDVSASGSASGGTDNITKIVAQGDIDNATNKIKAADSSSVKQQLASGLQSKGLLPVSSTFLAAEPVVTTSAKAGDTADNVTVTAVTTFTMFGVKKSDLVTIVTSNVDKQIDKNKQEILDDGVANAKFSQQSPGSATGANVSMSVSSLAGPDLDVSKLKTQIAGLKSGDVKTLIKQTPGVTDVQVKLSPFWVNAVPKKTTKITITIDKTGAQ
ncbi:MAG TPA: hypothetical protein VLF59_03805 [Candidatus Saccharimonadales bacterium]|nr:hypothetical protein [Candidatus Saccharimonadales bacterium]